MISATFVINVTVGFIVGAYVAMTIPGFKPAVYQTLSAIRKTTSGMFAQITTSKPKPKRVQTAQEFSEHEFSEDEGSD
jgi:hypothetical protein